MTKRHPMPGDLVVDGERVVGTVFDSYENNLHLRGPHHVPMTIPLDSVVLRGEPLDCECFVRWEVEHGG